MVATGEAALAIATRRLDRHDGRRRRGIPTVSVVAGPAPESSALLSRWAADRGRTLAWIEPGWPEPAALAGAWTGRLAAGCGLVDEAIAWLERRLDRPAGSLGPSLRGKTPFELAMFLDRMLPSVSSTGVETACRWVLCTAAGRDWRDVDGGAPADLRGLGAELESFTNASPCVHPDLRAVVALGELVPPERQPVLVLAPPGHGAPTWVDRAARMLADLALAQPRLACCLVLEADWLRAYLDGAGESRARALVRESVVTIPDDEPDEGEAARFIAVPRAQGAPECDPADDDRARSAAERLLFDRLEATPETAGLFRLNETIDLAFGHNRQMEIDLAAPALKLAVEVDGYYHFQDPEAYRRDRRKDLELQKDGYLVVRVLAQDVLAEPGGAIETILGAIAHRRGRPGASVGDHA
jgi:very-short-patch-repair endonuclease